MKTFIRPISLLAACIGFCYGCENINDIHAEYLERGETIYTGIVDSLSISPGNERAKFRWMLNADPRITKVVIYWDERGDSAIVKVNRTQPGIMWMEEVIPFPEGSYIFEVVTKDDEGHRSIATSLTSEVYGPEYISTLANRRIKDIRINEENQGVLSWANIISTTLQYTLVRYTDYSDGTPIAKEVRVENEETETLLPGVRPGDQVTVASFYLPENAMEEFAAEEETYSF